MLLQTDNSWSRRYGKIERRWISVSLESEEGIHRGEDTAVHAFPCTSIFSLHETMSNTRVRSGKVDELTVGERFHVEYDPSDIDRDVTI